jgi:hypothetical protein
MNKLSTVHQLERVTSHIKREYNRTKTSTGMVLLDVEKAFDRVWHQGLLYKMKIQIFPPYLIKIVASFLHNRKFEVFVHDQKSKIKR